MVYPFSSPARVFPASPSSCLSSWFEDLCPKLLTCERVTSLISDQADKPEAKPIKHDSIAPQHAMQNNRLDRAVSEHSSAHSSASTPHKLQPFEPS